MQRGVRRPWGLCTNVVQVTFRRYALKVKYVPTARKIIGGAVTADYRTQSLLVVSVRGSRRIMASMVKRTVSSTSWVVRITMISPPAVASITVKWIIAANDKPNIYRRNANGRWRGTYRPGIILPSILSPFNPAEDFLRPYRVLNHSLLFTAKCGINASPLGSCCFHKVHSFG